MVLMRFSYFVALVLTITIGVTYWYQSTSYICPAPLAYRLGDIDDSFSITRAQAIEATDLAVTLWEDASAVDLFTYDDNANLTVSFVFDERQAEANAQQSDEATLDAVKDQNDGIKNTIEVLQTSYEAQQAAFLARKAQYDAALALYDQAVMQANDRGGAAPAEFEELEATKADLQSELQSLRTASGKLAAIAGELNELTSRSNQLVQSYNRDVGRYNNRYSAGEEFTQGDYTGDAIHIYKFSNQNELVSVLAHEFGHALGIDHLDEEQALMHYLLEEGDQTTPQLSSADITALNQTCDVTAWDFQLRQAIRSVF